MEIEKIFDIVDSAKQHALYGVANAAFAVLLHWSLSYSKDENSGLSIIIETDDEKGNDQYQSFYDLIAVEGYGRYACIPLPLLEVCTVASIMKRGIVRERGVHNRQHIPCALRTEMKLWSDLVQYVGMSRLKEIAESILKEGFCFPEDL